MKRIYPKREEELWNRLKLVQENKQVNMESYTSHSDQITKTKTCVDSYRTKLICIQITNWVQLCIETTLLDILWTSTTCVVICRLLTWAELRSQLIKSISDKKMNWINMLRQSSSLNQSWEVKMLLHYQRNENFVKYWTLNIYFKLCIYRT